MLGGIGSRRRRGRQWIRCLDGIVDSMAVSLSELRELMMDRESWRAAIHGVTKSRTRLSDWTVWTEWKNHRFDYTTFVNKVISLLFKTLSKFVIAFLPKSKCLNFMAAVTICSDFGASQNKVCHCFHCFPHLFCHEEMGSESAALNRPKNLENSAVPTGLEKVSFHSNHKERQCQRNFKLLHNCTHLTF